MYPWGKAAQDPHCVAPEAALWYSAKTGLQLKARLDEMKCDASNVMKPQGEIELLLHVSVLCIQEE